MDVATLGQARALGDKRYARQKHTNVATRLFGGRMASRTVGTTFETHQITAELQGHFDAVRPIFASANGGFSPSARLTCASVVANKTDLNNSGGTWVNATSQGLSYQYIATAHSSSSFGTRLTYTTTDWIPISSIPRDDGGTKPIIIIRAAFTAAPITVYGNGTDSFTNWATRTDGRMWCSRYQGILALGGTVADFTTTTNQSQNAIVGIQYLHRGEVVTVAGVGDSITDGRGSYLGEGPVMPAVEALSTPGLAYEYMNLGWSGQAIADFGERAIDALESDLMRPDVLVMPAGSPNDPANNPITDANVTTWRNRRSRVQAAARRYGVPLVTWTVLPVNTAVNNWGATDSKRTAYNAETLAQPGLLVADIATAVAGSTSGGQVQLNPAYEDDGIHLNDPGNTLAAGLLKPLIERAARESGAPEAGSDARNAFPVYLITDPDATVTNAGIWVYAGNTSDGAWTVGTATPTRPDSRLFVISARETAKPLTLTCQSGTFAYAGTTSATLLVPPGRSVLLTPRGAGYDVHFLASGNLRRVLTDSTTALTLTRDKGLYVFTGASAPTWTLPAVASHTGVEFLIKNRGSATITVQRAGADSIYDTAAVTSITVAAGATVRLINDGTYWLLA